MKKKAIKLFSIYLVALFLSANLVIAISASDNATNDNTVPFDFSEQARSIYLYSCDANRTIFSFGENEIIAVGPAAKIMTGLIACEILSHDIDRYVSITSDMVKDVSGNSMQLKEGMILTVNDLLYGTICGGNNDAAQSLALLCDTSLSEFVQRMNLYASSLGMSNTVFSNPTGLDNTQSQTTITDVAKLVKKASKNDLYMEISSAKSHKISEYFTVYNRNALISQFSAQGYLNKNANGIIAGSTDTSGYMVATVAKKEGTSYICIVMGAILEDRCIYSYYIANKLTDFAFDNFGFKKVISANDDIHSINVNFALAQKNNSNFVCTVPKDVYAYIPNNLDVNDLQYKIYLHSNEIEAPISANTIVGGVDIYHDDMIVARSTLITKDDVEKNNILFYLNTMKRFLISRYFILFLVILIPSVIIYLYIDHIRSRHKKVRTVTFRRFY